MELLSRTCKSEQMNVQRVFARLLVLLGAVFAFWLTFGAKYAYQGSPLTSAAVYGLVFVVGVTAVFVLGLFFEYLAALVLAVGGLALIVWGIVAGWEGGTWGVMTFLFLLPMLASAALYAAAARMQHICALEEGARS